MNKTSWNGWLVTTVSLKNNQEIFSHEHVAELPENGFVAAAPVYKAADGTDMIVRITGDQPLSEWNGVESPF